jgi:GTP-binding protein HflX
LRFSAGTREPERPGCRWRSRASIILRPGCGKPEAAASGRAGESAAKEPGETSLELDKRRIRDRTKELREELAAIGDEHQTRRARREHELTVALVGYTNAGKSSLMRAMTGSEVLVADKLFATLDTTIRPLYPETCPKVPPVRYGGFHQKAPA